jgi:hypothetical protein
MEETRLVHSALSHQEVEVRVKIDLVPKCLNGRDDPGHKLASGYNLAIAGQRPEGQAAERPEEPAVVLEEDPQHLCIGGKVRRASLVPDAMEMIDEEAPPTHVFEQLALMAAEGNGEYE